MLNFIDGVFEAWARNKYVRPVPGRESPGHLVASTALSDRTPFSESLKSDYVRTGVLVHLKPSDRLKRSLDVVAAATILLLLLPLLATVCVVLAAQGWPLLVRHNRVGRGGQQFPCLKFRSMVVAADNVLQQHLTENASARQEWEATRKLKNDPRITPIGKVMRKTSIDELPQLINVLRGDMSLVGPRPIVEAEAVHYGPHIERYYAVRPGLTGAWQISGRSDTSYDQRVALDCAYVAERSFGRDLAILVKTVPAVLASKGSY